MATVKTASPPLLAAFSHRDAIFIAGTDRSELKLGCSGGSIGGPIHFDRDRRFVATGSFEDYNPGPQMVEDGVQAQPPVRFAGCVSGDTLALSGRAALRPAAETKPAARTRAQAGALLLRHCVLAALTRSGPDTKSLQ